MTNYEKIQSLSLDEMAKSMLVTFGDCCSVCTHFTVDKCDGKTTCVEGIKEWLTREAEEKL